MDTGKIPYLPCIPSLPDPMRVKTILFVGIILGAAVIWSAMTPTTQSAPDPEAAVTESREAFDAMMSVIMHPRCMNCHPSDDRPRQGMEGRIHYFGVQRGADGHGVPALKCGTCHQKENNDFSGVPGAPHWHLAPRSMGWMGLSRGEVARAILDPAKNGGRTLEETVTHLTEDELVLWAWEPGVNHAGIPREKPPISKQEWIDAVKTWAANGAPIPETE